MTNRMARKLKIIISVFFLLVFLLPSLVKLEHQHDDFKCKAINEKHIHVQHEKCGVCNFEFSVFLSDFAKIDFQKETYLEFFCDNYDSVNFADPSQYSFSLRGPPVILV
jgi:hypothetical protein